jgi:hypothetical protein
MTDLHSEIMKWIGELVNANEMGRMIVDVSADGADSAHEDYSTIIIPFQKRVVTKYT